MSRRILVVGGTSAIARACMKLWSASAPTEFVLVGRDGERLDAVGADLVARSPRSRATSTVFEFSPDGDIAALVDTIFDAGPVDIALIAHGSLPDQGDVEGDLVAIRGALETNAMSPALFAEAIASRMLAQHGGRLGIISSVAGDRGRRSNYVYGSAKALLSAYAEGLWHRLADSPVSITLIKPGPTATPMTESLPDGGRLADVDKVAETIVDAIERRSPVVYAPTMWRLIMSVVRAVPHGIFRRLSL